MKKYFTIIETEVDKTKLLNQNFIEKTNTKEINDLISFRDNLEKITPNDNLMVFNRVDIKQFENKEKNFNIANMSILLT